MSTVVVDVLWQNGAQQCILYKVDGKYELRLRRLENTIRLETCTNEDDGRRKACEWLIGMDIPPPA